MKIMVTKDEAYKAKWDHFILHNTMGNHLQLSDWLQSYESYGFDYELVIIEENDVIIGGFGAVIAKVLFFKFYVVPCGPIIADTNATVVKQLLEIIPQQAKKHKACYCQVSFPEFRASNGSNDFHKDLVSMGYEKGNLFKYVYSSNGLNWLDFEKYQSIEDILLDFRSTVRRDIRSAERKEHQIKFLTSESEIKAAYDLCLENAKKYNYSLRGWNSFKGTLYALVEKGTAKFIAAYKDDDLKGAIFLVKAGNYYTYILGGTKKEKPDLLTGHLLQWEAIKLSFTENCDGYNISLGGSEGVKDFKSNFVSHQFINENSKFYQVINTKVFKFFLFFDKKVRPQKKRIATILAYFKKK